LKRKAFVTKRKKGRKEGRKEGRKKERKKGRKKGRKGGRKEGRQALYANRKCLLRSCMICAPHQIL
jgi:flagellar biosynthesis/type III secretory pathway protein FliH